jgi:hypothetical protein
MNIRELITEEFQLSIPDMFGEFLPIAMQVLKIDKLPKIHLKAHIRDQEQPTFGGYVHDEIAIYLAIADRHPNDILRTLAHELVHFKQHSQGQLGLHSGDTGSPEENEANQVAGIIMRYFNKKYPNYISTKPLTLDEHKKGVRARKYNKKPKKYIQPIAPTAPTLNVDEANKRKRKSRRASAAYGPGPYGGYGYYAGYSGDSGASGDGGGGESIEHENFADGKNPQDKGDSKRHGVPTKASVSTLRKVAKQGGRKGQLAHWMANMKSGREK